MAGPTGPVPPALCADRARQVASHPSSSGYLNYKENKLTEAAHDTDNQFITVDGPILYLQNLGESATGD